MTRPYLWHVNQHSGDFGDMIVPDVREFNSEVHLLYCCRGQAREYACERRQTPGYYNVTWNRQDTKGRNVAFSVYFCTLSAENQRFSNKVVLTD